ncbi:MAG: hypothetical protein L0K86_22860 [Actinomycetia bacterium]|nr:hypothetical protein [Actinomycetes bacterium]
MKRVTGGLVMCALLAGAIACTSEDPTPDPPPSKSIAVDPDDIVKHEAAAGAPISFGIDVPDGAVQVGPLVRQRRAEVADVIGGIPRRAEAFENDGPDDKSGPETRDPEEPTPPDFTTAMLRIDGDPSEVVQAMLAELADSLAGSDIDAEHWRRYCTVADGVYTGCRLHTRGKTDDDEHVAVEFTVDPGNAATKTAPAGSLLRPVMVLTLERIEPPEEDGDQPALDPVDAQASEAQAAIDAREAEERAKAAAAEKKAEKGKKNADSGKGRADDASDADPDQNAEETSDEEADSDDAEDSDKGGTEPKWPTMKREWPATTGDWILSPKCKVGPKTEVILSSSMPQVAMIAVKPGGDADQIARRFVRAFADEATTPKLDEVEDRNELSVTYTPRNDGSGPSVAVTTVATGRGNYIELLFSDGDPTDNRERRTSAASRDGRKKPGAKSTAKRTTSSTG